MYAVFRKVGCISWTDEAGAIGSAGSSGEVSGELAVVRGLIGSNGEIVVCVAMGLTAWKL